MCDFRKVTQLLRDTDLSHLNAFLLVPRPASPLAL